MSEEPKIDGVGGGAEPETDLQDFMARIPQLPETDEQKRAQQREQRKAWLEGSGILQAITEDDCNFLIEDNLPLDTHALGEVKRWLNIRAQDGVASGFAVLGLVGLTGRGKTLALGWLLGQKGQGVYCMSEDLRVSFEARESKTGGELWRRALGSRSVAIDEIGRETDVRSASDALFYLINHRRGRLANGYKAWTGLGGNISVEDFRGRFVVQREGYPDLSLITRVEQSGMIVNVRGEDLRVPLAKRLREEIKQQRAKQLELGKGGA